LNAASNEFTGHKEIEFMKAKSPAPEIVLREGRPVAVILDIDEYKEMLERLEDAEDLKQLKNMRRRPLKFKALAKLLAEYSPDV
jgi:PHD/YefM family antitoxin component YafN of YafNO toxin-antitoxin module